MREFVRDQRDQALVADQHSWRGERHVRVFHAAERKRWWQHENVVTTPAIRPVQFFCGHDHLFGVLELVRRLGDHGRFGVHRAARACFADPDVARGDREQVRRNRLGLREAEVAVQRVLRIVERAHHHTDIFRRGDVRGVSEADRRRILQRHPRARVDRFGLREHERLFLVRGLRWRQPLQAGSLRRRRVDDAHLGRMARRDDAQLAAQVLVARRQREFQHARFAVRIERADTLDAEIARIEHQL